MTKVIMDDIQDISKRTPFEIFYSINKRYKENPNGFSFWFNKIKDVKEFKQPKTAIIPIDFELYSLIMGVYDHEPELKKECKKMLTNMIDDARIKAGIEYPMFMKTGLFSNKFVFYQCLQLYKEHVADHYLSINYAAMCMSCDTATEIVIRELIKVKPFMYLYDGLPMNIEFRCFINFNTKKIIAINDYWHESIKNDIPSTQKAPFVMTKVVRQKEYEKYKEIVIEKLNKDMNNFDLVGSWSVDIMVDMFGDLWITDMAIAPQSWGRHLLTKQEQADLDL